MKKKLFLAVLTLIICSAGVMAQDVDKAAAKAAKAELKAKQKAAEKTLSDAMGVNSKIVALEQANAAERALGKSCKQEVIDENNAKCVELSREGISALTEAVDGAKDLMTDKTKLFEAYVAQARISNYILNDELQKYKNKVEMNLDDFAKSVRGLSDAYHGQITFGNEKDDAQKSQIAFAKVTLPKTKAYSGYLSQFYMQKGELDGACKAYDDYKSFGERYPETADDEEVKNPTTPNGFFANNLYALSFNQGNLEAMDKYRDEASKYEGANHDLILYGRAEVLKKQGLMKDWVNETKNIIATCNDSDAMQKCMASLMAYYSSKDKDGLDGYTIEMVTKYPTNKLANYMRGYCLFSKEEYKDASGFFKKAQEIDPDYSEAVYMTGLSLYRIAGDKASAVAGKKVKSEAEKKKYENEVRGLFKQALPYIEKYRSMAEDKPDDWAGILYTIYNNTNQPQKAAAVKKYMSN